jgi:hypothetical protein
MQVRKALATFLFDTQFPCHRPTKVTTRDVTDFADFVPSMYVQQRSLSVLHIPLLDTTCFGLTGHLHVYRLLWLGILMLTLMCFPFFYCHCLWLFVMWVTISFDFIHFWSITLVNTFKTTSFTPPSVIKLHLLFAYAFTRFGF